MSGKPAPSVPHLDDRTVGGLLDPAAVVGLAFEQYAARDSARPSAQFTKRKDAT